MANSTQGHSRSFILQSIAGRQNDFCCFRASMAHTTLNKMATVLINNICSFINNFILWHRINDKRLLSISC